MAPHPRWNDHVDESIEVAYSEPSDRPTEKLGKPLKVVILVHRPRPSVTDDQRPEPLRVPSCHPEADRTSPVLNHHGHVGEVEGEEEALDCAGVLGRGKVVALPRSGEPEPWVVKCDAPEAVAQPLDDLSVKEGLRACANRRATFRTCQLQEGVQSLSAAPWHLCYPPIGASS